MKTLTLPDPAASRRAMVRTRDAMGFLITALSFLCLLALRMPHAVAQTLPLGFREEIVFSGLAAPAAVEFAFDGRVFVAEKSALIKGFSSLSATVPTVFVNLRTTVHSFWDHGLLGVTLHPTFRRHPSVWS